nr:unnamed protein product [Callosobruchus chinensis]
MNNMSDPNNKVTTPVDGGTSPATTKMFFALGNVNNNINNNINNNNNGNNNNNNNNGYRLLSAQGMETLQAFLREHGNECIKQFVKVGILE